MLRPLFRRQLLALLSLLAVTKPAYAADMNIDLALQIAELPFLMLTICACLFTSWALFRWPVTLPAKLLAKAMLFLAAGFVIMGASHLKMQYQRAFSTNIFHSFFGEEMGDILWLIASLSTWVLIIIGLMLIVRFIVRQQSQLTTSALRIKNENLEKDANVDPLTNIWNRRFLFRDGESLMDSLRGEGSSVCLLSMALDHFKAINDTHGHAAGDMTLKKFCEIVQTNIRSNDLFARNGGEKFVLLMPRVNQEEAYRIANRILISVERQSVSYEGKPVRFTVSMGMVYRDRVDMSIEELLIAADKALYEAKQSGCNKLSTASIGQDLENVVAFRNVE